MLSRPMCCKATPNCTRFWHSSVSWAVWKLWVCGASLSVQSLPAACHALIRIFNTELKEFAKERYSDLPDRREFDTPPRGQEKTQRGGGDAAGTADSTEDGKQEKGGKNDSRLKSRRERSFLRCFDGARFRPELKRCRQRLLIVGPLR